MFEILFLGTSASAPSVHRGLSCQVIKHDEYRFLVDCGEGTQRQLLCSGIGFKRLNRILITHGHLDHILGLAGLISTFARWETIDELEIFGNNGFEETSVFTCQDLLGEIDSMEPMEREFFMEELAIRSDFWDESEVLYE